MGPRLTNILGILTMMGGRHPKEVEMHGGRARSFGSGDNIRRRHQRRQAVEKRAPLAVAAGAGAGVVVVGAPRQ
jgi:hypothetical protein